MTAKECHKKPLKKGERVRHVDGSLGTVMNHDGRTSASIQWDKARNPLLTFLSKVSRAE